MFTFKKKSSKILCLLLAVALLFGTLPMISVSALDAYVAGSNIAYNDSLITVTENGNSAHITYDESTDYWNAIQYKDAIIVSRGVKIKVDNIVLDSGDYMFYMNFGTTWGNQGTDKGGFTVLYDEAGTFAVYENNGAYQPQQNDPYAVVATVDPLTSAGFTFDMRFTNSKYTIKLTTPTNTYNFVFDPSHALENTIFPNSPFYYGHTVYMAAAMLNKSYIDMGGWGYNAPTPAGISFDISLDNSQGITDSLPAGFDYIGPCWAWKTTENGTQFNIASSQNGTAGQRVRYVEGDGVLHSAEASGTNINIKDITAGTTKNYSVAICLEMPNDATGWNWAYYSNPECLMLLYDADGDFAICDTSAGTENWVALYSTKLESCDEKLLRDLDINVKFNETTKVYTFTVNGNQFEVDGTKYLEHTYGLFGAHFGIMGGFDVGGDNKVTMANFGNWNYYNAFLGDGTNDIASFTINNISFNTPISVNIPKAEKFLGIGELSDLGTVVTPANANDATVTYSSSDTSVVTVDANGTLTGIGVGSATVTASLKNGLTDTCDITVLNSVDGVASVFKDAERSTTISYQENADYTRVFFNDEYVGGNLITRQGMYRTTLKKNFSLATEPVTLTFKDFIGTTADYALIISIGNSSNQYMDTPGYNLLIDFDGDYAVWSGNGVFNDRQLLAYGNLGNYLVSMDALIVKLSKENDKIAFDLNGTKFTLDNTAGINLDGGLVVSLGTCGDFVSDSSNGTLDKDATWMTNIGGLVAFVMDNSEIEVQNVEVIKEIRAGAENDVILTGKTATNFDMDSNLTRGEAIVAMAKLIASDDVIIGAYTCDFTDINSEDANYSYYAFMQKCGYLPDYGETLSPDTAITRGELVDLLYNVDANATVVTVNDVLSTDAIYTKVCQAVNSGALTLDSNNNFNPAATIARGVAAKAFCVLAGKDFTMLGTNAFTDLIFGDINGDTKVNLLDLVALKKAIVNQSYKMNIDLNGDGTVVVSDLVVIRKLILGSADSGSAPEYVKYSILSSNPADSKKTVTVNNTVQLLNAVSEAQLDTGNVEIELANGIYNITSPVSISNNTNSITLKAASGATPVISSNVDIPASSFTKVSGKNYYSCKLNGHPKFRNLYLNGELLTLAKSQDYTFSRDINGNCFYVDNGISELTGDVGSLEICLDIEWMQKHYRVKSLSSGVAYDTLSIEDEEWYAYTYYDGNKYSFNGRKYHFENHLSLLDEPNEFYYDSTTGTVYVYPLSDVAFENAVISYPSTEKLFDLSNSSNVTFDGLSLTGVTSNFTSEHGFNGGQGGSHDWLDSYEAKKGSSAYFYGKTNTLQGFDSIQIPSAAIYCDNSSELTIKNCKFYELGANGIVLAGSTYNSAINNNKFDGISMSAISIGNRRDMWSRVNGQTLITVNGNYIKDIGREYTCCTALIIGAVRNYSVVHNTVINTSASGIAAGVFTDTDGKGINIMNAEIAYNYCKDNMMSINDGSGIYFCGANDLVKNKNIYNRIHDNYVTGDSTAQIYTGIYLDANCSNTGVYNNVIEGIVTDHQPIFNQDIVSSQYTHNNIVENNYTTGKSISTNTISNKSDPKADYTYRNIIVRNNTYSATLGTEAIAIKSNTGSILV